VIDGTPFTPTEVEIGHYTVTGTDANGCIAVDDMNLTVNALPVISFSADNIGCTDFETEFTIVSDVAISTTDWTFGDGDVAFGMTNPITPHVYFDGGVYTVKATVTDINGCVSSETYTDYITVEDHPIAAFTFSPQSVYTNDTEIEFTNESMYSTDYSWDFDDGTPMTNETDPIHFFPSEVGDVFYPVELKATNYLGCVDSVTAYINVKSIILFYIPNAFTPDGDQYNQEFKPVFESGYDPYDYKMVIYNRYGEIIFETHDVNYGWSGTYGTNGELVQNGVYTWAIDFKELHTDKRYSHSGHITVLK
jgi:gliding motility-associated-like protein